MHKQLYQLLSTYLFKKLDSSLSIKNTRWLSRRAPCNSIICENIVKDKKIRNYEYFVFIPIDQSTSSFK